MLKMNRKKVAALFMIFGILPQSVSFAEEKLDQYNLDEIVVTASQEKIKQELNTPATTEIFTAEDIKNYNGSNVQEVLEYAAGAIAAQPTGVGSTFGMRGLTGASRNPTILVDGVPLNMQVCRASVTWTLFPLMLLKESKSSAVPAQFFTAPIP